MSWKFYSSTAAEAPLVQTLAAATTVTFSGLNGDVDEGYEFMLMGRGGSAATGDVKLRPNGLTTNLRGRHVQEGDGLAPAQATRTDGFLADIPGGGTVCDITIKGVMSAKSGRERLCRFESTRTYGAANHQNFAGGITWTDTTTNLTSLEFHMAGGTFTGVAMLRKVKSAATALGGTAEKVLSVPAFIPAVTALPAGPTDGQECYYIAGGADGVIWHLKYRAASTSAYKWEYVGGSPLNAEVANNENTASTTFTNLTTTGPSVVLPLAGDYDVQISSVLYTNLANMAGYMSYAIGATAAADADAIYHSSPAGSTNNMSYGSRVKRKAGLAAATTLLAKYRGNNGGGAASFQERHIEATPVRVG